MRRCLTLLPHPPPWPKLCIYINQPKSINNVIYQNGANMASATASDFDLVFQRLLYIYDHLRTSSRKQKRQRLRLGQLGPQGGDVRGVHVEELCIPGALMERQGRVCARGVPDAEAAWRQLAQQALSWQSGGPAWHARVLGPAQLHEALIWRLSRCVSE